MKHAFILLVLGAAGCANTPSTVEAPTSAPAPAPPAAPGAKTYAVHFGRESRVGERLHFVKDHASDMITKITRDGAPIPDQHDKREKHTLHYDAVSTVVAVDTKGRSTRLRYDVKDLTSDGQRLPASIIELTRHAKEKDADIIVDGSPTSEDVRKALHSLLKLGLDGASDDEIFGPKTPQAIGAHWAIDEPLAIASFKDDGVDVSTIKGEVWLDGTTNIDGAECLSVHATLDMRGMKIPDLPPGSVMEEGHATAQMSAVLPLDGRVGRAVDHLTTKLLFRIRVPAPQGSPMIVSVEAKETDEAHETAM